MSSTYWGLCFYDVHYRVLTLPLLRVKATVTIKEINAQVKLTQTFGNDSPNPIEAIYSFPVPARAAVCGFTMIRQNGTRVVAVVQEKAEAQQTYDTAIAQGKTASLMAQQTPDVFQVSVGNIAPQEEVQVELVYATELTEDEESDSVRFLLPVHIGSRYGSGPSLFTPNSSSFININVAIETMTPIRKIGCPSHSISTELGPDPVLPNANQLPFSNYARISLSADTPLQKDFVLTILSAGLDTPRCVAELHPEHDTIGMALTLVPRFSLPDRPNQEFIFLVDRSGSMDGNRIAAARKALVVMLRSLPHKNAVFQIASFGSHSDLLWKAGSRPYNQETLDEATKFVDSMGANYGGTGIRMALAMCFRARDKNRAMSIFLLTDGDAWDLNGVLDQVTRAVDAAPLKTRVFCLGIGNSASTAMCEGIARVGNGACMMVGEQESTMTGKIARLVRLPSHR
ncbi:von Willebrand factor type A domain-containing protein [Mucidula mucida]|nr:von Willebrand factor type A domain-containing protein [Mucidula mucida]